MIKKITAFITALVVCCSFVSCSGSAVSSPEKTEKITDDNADNVSDISGTSVSDTSAQHGETFTSDQMSFDYISSQCSGCNDVLDMRISLAKANAHLLSSDENRDIYLEKLVEIEDKIYNLMQHNCTADMVYVEDYPLVYNQYHGTYTGYWQGGGPSGQGTFTAMGYVPLWQEDYEIVYQYSGDWKYGLPDGQGSYIYHSFQKEVAQANNYYQEYVGGMKAGRKNGDGTEYEKYPSHEFYYNTGYYENNQLTERVYYNEFDNDGNLLSAGYAADLGNGKDIMHMNIAEYTYIPGEAKMDAVGVLIITAIVAEILIVNHFDKFDLDEYREKLRESSMAELEAYRERKEEENKKIAEEQEQQKESYRQYCETKYYEYKKKDPDELLRDTRYFKANMY